MDQQLIARAASLVEKAAAWEPGTFSIEPALEWTRSQPQLLMAHPTVRRPDSVPVAILDDGELLTPYDENAFSRLVRSAFPDPNENDAFDLARLALWFADFGSPVGELVEAIPVSARPAGTLPRKAEGAQLTRRNQIAQLRFYSMDFELSHLYDCEVVIEPGSIRLRARNLTQSALGRDNT